MNLAITFITIISVISISLILSSRFTLIPLPLLQILFGFMLGLSPLGGMLEIEPESFLLLIIAPLLYLEGSHIDAVAFWREKRSIFSMAFLAVFITVLVLGLFTHRLFPLIPLAACFALGSILAPTDAVAISTLSDRVKFSEKNLSILAGEGLINDASGVIALQFSVTALLTGAFSPSSALLKLIYVCVGGLLVGYILASIKKKFTRALRMRAMSSTSIYMLLELITPFLCYLAAEVIGVSGILATVAAGSVNRLNFNKAVLSEAEFGHTKNTVWSVLSTILNSLVFLLLGIQLPSVIAEIIDDKQYSMSYLLLATVLIATTMLAVRFVCVSVFLRAPHEGGSRTRKKDVLELMLSGPKGTISLAAAFSLPLLLADGGEFSARPILLFITAGVIVLSLAQSLFLLPLVAEPSDKNNEIEENKLLVFQEVILRLQKMEKLDVSKNYSAIISGYQKQIEDVTYYTTKERRELKELRAFIVQIELMGLNECFSNRKYSTECYRKYGDILLATKEFSNHALLAKLKYAIYGLKLLLTRLFYSKAEHNETSGLNDEMQEIFFENTALIVRSMDQIRTIYSDQLIDKLISERLFLAEQILEGNYLETLQMQLSDEYRDLMLSGFEVERQIIREYEGKAILTNIQANALRRDVNRLESFIISEEFNPLVYHIVNIAENA